MPRRGDYSTVPPHWRPTRTSFALCRCRPWRRHCFCPGRMMIARCSERIRVGMDITRRIAEDDGCICRSSFPGDFGRHRLIVDVGVLVVATTTTPLPGIGTSQFGPSSFLSAMAPSGPSGRGGTLAEGPAATVCNGYRMCQQPDLLTLGRFDVFVRDAPIGGGVLELDYSLTINRGWLSRQRSPSVTGAAELPGRITPWENRQR